MADGENGLEDGAEIDDRQGVAVVFDDKSEDEDGAGMVNEVRDESSEDEAEDRRIDQVQKKMATAGGAADDRDEEARELPEEEAMIIDSGPRKPRGRKEKAKSFIPAREIDAYWLQRQIGQVYSDAHIQQVKTQEALTYICPGPQRKKAARKSL